MLHNGFVSTLTGDAAPQPTCSNCNKELVQGQEHSCRDGCAVPTAPLSSLIYGFVSEWERGRPATGGQFSQRTGTELARAEVGPVKALEWLAQETGIPVPTIENIMRKPKQRPTTEYRYADAIVTALDRSDLFYDGRPPTLPVSPNPSASKAARANCCSGSSQADRLTNLH